MNTMMKMVNKITAFAEVDKPRRKNDLVREMSEEDETFQDYGPRSMTEAYYKSNFDEESVVDVYEDISESNEVDDPSYKINKSSSTQDFQDIQVDNLHHHPDIDDDYIELNHQTVHLTKVVDVKKKLKHLLHLLQEVSKIPAIREDYLTEQMYKNIPYLLTTVRQKIVESQSNLLIRYESLDQEIEKLKDDIRKLEDEKNSLLDPIYFTYFQGTGIEPTMHVITDHVSQMIYSYYPTSYKHGQMSIFINLPMIKQDVRLQQLDYSSVCVALYLLPINKLEDHLIYNLPSDVEIQNFGWIIEQFIQTKLVIGHVQIGLENPICTEANSKVMLCPDHILTKCDTYKTFENVKRTMISLRSRVKSLGASFSVAPIYYKDTYKESLYY
jgi:hypothetical protein